MHVVDFQVGVGLARVKYSSIVYKIWDILQYLNRFVIHIEGYYLNI
jgi:hypothetical protein